MINNNFKNENQQIVITLALIQKALEDLTERVEEHHYVLYGNGDPENSIIWAIKTLTHSINNLEKQLKKYHDEGEIDKTNTQKEINSLLSKDENLNWKQWFKKLTIRWLPYFSFILIILLIFRDKFIDIFSLLIKLIVKI